MRTGFSELFLTFSCAQTRVGFTSEWARNKILHTLPLCDRRSLSSSIFAVATFTRTLYKALFELSADRADFVSLLFTRQRPEGLNPASTAQEIFDAYWRWKQVMRACSKRT